MPSVLFVHNIIAMYHQLLATLNVVILKQLTMSVLFESSIWQMELLTTLFKKYYFIVIDKER